MYSIRKILNCRKGTLYALLLIIVIAGFFRLWLLCTIPGGLFPDEAANGLDILLIQQGHHTPFFERGLGREALFFYLQAISVALFGIGVWQLHLVSAIIGILTVIASWFLMKKLFNTTVAFFAAFFLATSSWHTTLSRTGFRAIMVPLMATLFFYFAYLTFKEISGKKRTLFAILTGLSLGLGFYTYIAFRVIVGIIGLFVFIFAIVNRGVFKKFWREIVIGLISMLIILTPLIIYFVGHPLSFVGRSGYVSIFNPDLNHGDLLGTFWGVLKTTFWMFFTNGDLNWRHNVSGFSMLNPLVASLFALGFLYTVFLVGWGIWKRKPLESYLKYLFLIVWFLMMLVPEVLSAESIPHGLRAIGAMPSVFFFPALGLNFIWNKLPKKNMKVFWSLIFGTVLFASLIYDYSLYFGISANSADFHYAYRSDLTVVSNYLNERNLKEKTFLVLDAYSVQTPEFLTSRNNQPYILLDPAKSYQVQPKPGDQIVFTQSTIYDAKKFEEYHPEAKIIKREFNQFQKEIIRVYQEI